MKRTVITNHVSVVFISSLFLLSARLCIAGQTSSDSLSFYPLQNGDYWEYYDLKDFGGVEDTVFVSVLRDSIVWNRTYHLVMTHSRVSPNPSYSLQRLDSIDDVFQYDPASDSDQILYKLSDSIGAIWRNNFGEVAVIDSLSSRQVFGSTREILLVAYYRDTTFAFPLGAAYLARGLGVIGTFDGEGGGWDIRGAVIAGTTFGNLTSVQKHRGSGPSRFQLYQNYPNPFNPSTLISFDLPSTSNVSLRIFDVLGRKVATLVSGELPAGHHSYDWIPAGLASGVYYYQLISRGQVETKKLMLLK